MAIKLVIVNLLSILQANSSTPCSITTSQSQQERMKLIDTTTGVTTPLVAAALAEICLIAIHQGGKSTTKCTVTAEIQKNNLNYPS